MGRFNYVRYDAESIAKQEQAKTECEILEKFITESLPPGRAQSLALTSLEECYMWIGKAIRDDQIKRGSQVEHMPERGE